MLKGLIKCAHCSMSLWAQTLKSGSRLYQEQARSRSHIECPGDSKSIRCETPDEQIGRIVGAIILPAAWMDRVLATIHLADEVERVKGERIGAEQRLKRLGDVYLDGIKTRDDYLREKKALQESSIAWSYQGSMQLGRPAIFWRICLLCGKRPTRRSGAEAPAVHAGCRLRGHC